MPKHPRQMKKSQRAPSGDPALTIASPTLASASAQASAQASVPASVPAPAPAQAQAQAPGKTIMGMFVILMLPLPFLFGLVSGEIPMNFLGQASTTFRSSLSMTMATNISTTGFSSSSSSSVTQHTTPTPQLRKAALKFVASREHAYKVAGQHKHWKLRGHGHLFTYRNIALAAQVVADTSNTTASTTSNTVENARPSSSASSNSNSKNITMGRNMVKIWNVHPQATDDFDDCHLLSIWVRVNGPELLSGKARPVRVSAADHGIDSCHWEFPFDIQVPGTYLVDAKIIFWNGKAKVIFYDMAGVKNEKNQCPHSSVPNTLPLQEYQKAPQNTSLMGFKLYAPILSCCEICRRLPDCRYWATPPKRLPTPSAAQNGCEFYFASSQNATWIPTSRAMPNITYDQLRAIKRKAAGGRRQLWRLGNTRQRQRQQGHRRLGVQEAWGTPESDNSEVAHFLGCGWSYQFTIEFPCLSGNVDDRIYIETSEFEVVAETQAVEQHASLPSLPLCQLSNEHLTTFSNAAQLPAAGRWVREEWPSPEVCPEPYAVDVDNSKVFTINKHTPTHPHCWFREDLEPLNKKCLEVNCRLVERYGKWLSSPLQHENQWMGVWRNYQCDYLEFTDTQLSDCFQKLKVASVKLEGASISAMINTYMQQRLTGVTKYDSSRGDSRQTVVSTLKWPHLLWHMSEPEWRKELEALPSLLPKNATDAAALHPKRDVYWVSPFFTSSEREPYVHLERAVRLAEIAEEILAPKGYSMINGFDISAAFTYDTAGQADGMHILGPPLKAVVTKVFHHMCSNIVEGARA